MDVHTHTGAQTQSPSLLALPTTVVQFLGFGFFFCLFGVFYLFIGFVEFGGGTGTEPQTQPFYLFFIWRQGHASLLSCPDWAQPCGLLASVSHSAGVPGMQDLTQLSVVHFLQPMDLH